MGIFIVVINKISFFVLVSLSDNWSHVDDLINIKPAHKQIVKIVNGCGRWRSVNPSSKEESLLSRMSINSHPSRVSFAVCSCFPMVALDLENAIWWSSDCLCDIVKESYGTQGVLKVFKSICLARNYLIDDVDKKQENDNRRRAWRVRYHKVIK